MHSLKRIWRKSFLIGVLVLFFVVRGRAQVSSGAKESEVEELRQTVRELAARVSVLEEQLQRQNTVPTKDAAALAASVADVKIPADSPRQHGPAMSEASGGEAVVSANGAETPTKAKASVGSAGGQAQPSVVPAQLPGGATLNYYFDGYYGYDFNHPIARVQYLRAYDVLSNAFSINQAGLVMALDPSVDEGRRYGVRLDLQFGQATETLQGNPANEPRPDIYRNIFQAYGTYVFPVGKGLTVDVGKWSSSIGIEGNYTKDQMNYSRSLYFAYLPFYHMGVRANYKVNDKISVNYWLVNGTQQSEATNSYKDELFGLTLQPKKNLSWIVNYYVGQDHPDASANPQGCGSAPVQPGLCLAPITPAPDGKQHIFDSYATWNVTPNLTLALEGDYVISRLWANAAPGQSSAPGHVDGGAGYARYQWTPRMAVAGRAEYMSDRSGLFSGRSQALKEFTGTYEFKFADGFLSRLEYRRDWSNVPFFLTNKVGVLSSHQDTLTVGMVWWYGGRQGVW